MATMTTFEKRRLPIGGGDHVPVVVGTEDGRPSTVFMGYDEYLELAATLYLAIDTLAALGVEPGELRSETDDVLDRSDGAVVVPIEDARRTRRGVG